MAADIPDIKENLEFHKDVFEAILTAWSDSDASAPYIKSEFIDKTSDYDVAAKELNGLVTIGNNASGAEVDSRLPALAANYIFKAYVVDAQYIKIIANTGEKIRFLGTQSAAAGFIRSNTVGNSVTLKASGDDWVVTEIVGAWLMDE